MFENCVILYITRRGKGIKLCGLYCLFYLFIYIFYEFHTDDFTWTISYVCTSNKPLTINKSMFIFKYIFVCMYMNI